ncbi:hypothetical protein GDO78_006652 [Eleutherodactylus coqui]|uniref:Uncharacterized protein n=1 Tax=Eleutherodactylus coqui TaxID=57060 RepID=A0A8J6KCA2_ELECQ|nr:hypothetical protein GDO78_006652 [Eleutherodactylus coqui]
MFSSYRTSVNSGVVVSIWPIAVLQLHNGSAVRLVEPPRLKDGTVCRPALPPCECWTPSLVSLLDAVPSWDTLWLVYIVLLKPDFMQPQQNLQQITANLSAVFDALPTPPALHS